MKTKIRSVRPLSLAKIQGIVYGILGLLIAPFLLIGPGLAMLGGSTQHRSAGFGLAIVFAVFVPLCYAVVGFLIGGLMAFLYNAIASAVGGLEIQLDPTPLPAGIATLPSSAGSIFPTTTPPTSAPEFE
jgi:hypothetical protein